MAKFNKINKHPSFSRLDVSNILNVSGTTKLNNNTTKMIRNLNGNKKGFSNRL